jgi:uncharacterized SAM-binding protein YcdF (DUF218 family)
MIIILAHMLDREGRLNEESTKRLAKGAELYLAGGYRHIILPGGNERLEGDVPIAEMMADYLHKTYGIATKELKTETRSRDTVGDAYFAGEGLQPGSVLTVVTSSYHVKRAQYIFEFFLSEVAKIKTVGVEVQAPDHVKENESKSLAQFRKHFPTRGLTREESFEILCTRHPLYNGDIFPRIESRGS